MANKFTDSIKKNPNARDPQGQKGFDKADWDKGQAAEQKRVDEHVKQSNLKESVSKMQSTTKVQEANRDKNIIPNR